MRRPLVAGNWKMNGSREMTETLVSGIGSGLTQSDAVDVVVCPPFVYLDLCSAVATGTPIAMGAQDLDIHEPGAFTGAIAADMLVDIGCEFAILGHSERRSLYSESDADVGVKRERNVTADVVCRQLDAVIDETGIEVFPKALVAYEPVWAIGTGLTATDEQAQEVHCLIRQRIASASGQAAEGTRILYGGSVKPDNAAGLFSQPDIDGGLIGGASLKAADFLGIIEAAIL